MRKFTNLLELKSSTGIFLGWLLISSRKSRDSNLYKGFATSMRNGSDDETNSKTEDLTKLCTKIKKYRKTVRRKEGEIRPKLGCPRSVLGMGMTSIWTVVNLGVEGRDGGGGGVFQT